MTGPRPHGAAPDGALPAAAPGAGVGYPGHGYAAYGYPAPGYPGAGRPAGGSRPVGLADLVGVLVRRRWWVAGGGVAGAALAAAYLARAVPVYEAAASIRVDDRRAPTPEVIRTLPAGDEVSTEIEVLHSQSLAAAVVDSLGLRARVVAPRGARRTSVLAGARVADGVDSLTVTARRRPDGAFALAGGSAAAVVRPGGAATLAGVTLALARTAGELEGFTVLVAPREVAAASLLDAVSVNRSGAKANLVVLRFRDADPRVARDVLNAWAGVYMAQRNAVQKTEARSTAAFLRAQIDTLSAELAASEGSLRAFRERERVVDPQVEASAEVTRLAGARAEREQVEAERRALAGLLGQVRAADQAAGPGDAPSAYRRLVGFPTLLRNQVTTELLRSLAQVEDQRSALLQRRSPRDGDVQLLTARRRELEDQLRAVSETYLEGLTAQVAALDASLGRGGALLSRVPGREERLARLQRAPRVLEQLVTMLQTRLKEAQIAQAVEDPSVRLVDAAALPWQPAAPRAPLALGFGLFAGLCAGVSGAFAREYRSRALRTQTDVRAVTGTPVVGLVPQFAMRPARLLALDAADPLTASLAGLLAPTGAATGRGRRPARLASGPRLPGPRLPGPRRPAPGDERVARGVADAAYERLFVNAAYARPEGPPRSIVVTSPLPGDGKSTTAALLAATLARAGRRVLLVDADLRRGSLCALLGLHDGPGFADVLAGTHTLADVLCPTAVGSDLAPLVVVGPGRTSAWQGALSMSGALGAAVADAERAFEVVVIDSPPLNVVADAAVLGTHADGVLVVARAGRTTAPELEYALGQLDRVRAPVLGVVLNGLDPTDGGAYEGSYRHLAEAYAAYVAPAASR